MTTHTQAWSAAFEAVPANTDDANEGAQRIRNLKRDLRERLAVDHEMELAANSATADGRHKKVTLTQLDSEPSNSASEGYLYAYNNAGTAELHWMSENGATGTVLGSWNVATGLATDTKGMAYIDGVVENGASGSELKAKVVAIGDWDMDTGASKGVNHGLTSTDIRSVSVIVRNDDNANCYELYYLSGGYFLYNATQVVCYRIESGAFDSASFNATSFNRGWITIWYVA